MIKPKARILVLFVCFFAACAPAEVTNCAVRAYKGTGVLFEADILNRSEQTMEEINIEVDTASKTGSVGSAHYRIGPVESGRMTHVIKKIERPNSNDVFQSIGTRLSPIQNCSPQAILYQDGTSKVLYIPM